MRIVASFDPSQTTSDSFNAGFSNGVGRIVVYNESNINLQLGWDSFSTYCPAWTAMLYCISTNNVNINWIQQSVLQTNGNPISQVIVEAYDNNEAIMGTFPAPLVRSTNIGNSIPLSSSATSITNDNNVAGTSVVESTVSGQASSSISITNNGIFNLSVLIAGVLHQFLKTQVSGNLLQLGNASDVVEVLGKLLVDGNFLVNNGLIGHSAAGDIIDASGADTGIKVRGATNAIHLESPAGTDVLVAAYNGITCNQNISLPGGGGWSACANIGVTAPSISYPGSFSFTHNFGFIPQWMIYCPGTRSGTGEGSCTWGVDNFNNTTTCTITLGAKINGILIGGRNS